MVAASAGSGGMRALGGAAAAEPTLRAAACAQERVTTLAQRKSASTRARTKISSTAQPTTAAASHLLRCARAAADAAAPDSDVRGAGGFCGWPSSSSASCSKSRLSTRWGAIAERAVAARGREMTRRRAQRPRPKTSGGGFARHPLRGLARSAARSQAAPDDGPWTGAGVASGRGPPGLDTQTFPHLLPLGQPRRRCWCALPRCGRGPPDAWLVCAAAVRQDSTRCLTSTRGRCITSRRRCFQALGRRSSSRSVSRSARP